MSKFKFPIKTALFLMISIVMMSLARDIPETNAFLKDTDNKAVLSAVGDLKVTLNDSDAISTLTLNQKEQRRVTVTNDGETNMFIRLLIHPTLESDKQIQQEISVTEIIDNLSSEWKDGKDGYFYYQKKLETGSQKTTAPIFEQIKASSSMEKGDKLTLFLKVEAITAKGAVYREAWWQGQEPSAGTPLQEIDSVLQIVKD